MDWNLILTVVVLVVLVLLIAYYLTQRKTVKDEDKKFEDEKARSAGKVDRTLPIDPYAIVELYKDRVKQGVNAAFKEELPDPNALWEQFLSDEGWITAKGEVEFSSIGKFKFKAAKLPAGQIGMETSCMFEEGTETIIPHYYLSRVVDDIESLVDDATGLRCSDDAWKKVMSILLTYARNYFEISCTHYSMRVVTYLHNYGFDKLDRIPPSPFSEMHFSNSLDRRFSVLHACTGPKQRREYNEWLFYRKGTVPHSESEIESVTPEKFDEFNAVQDVRLQEAREYIHLLLDESLTHPDNIKRFGTVVNSCLSHHDSLIRKLDRKFNVSVSLKGVLGIELDVDMTDSRIEVNTRVCRIDCCLQNIYTFKEFMQVLNERLRVFLDSAMHQQFDGWSVDEAGDAVPYSADILGDSQDPHFKYSYWLTIIPPHRRNHDSDTQA